MSALQPGDFTLPEGELDPGQFDGVDLDAYLAVWLEEVSEDANDASARAWVYHRAFSLLADKFHAGVATAREGDVSGAKSAEQYAFWSERARSYLRKYKVLQGRGVVF